MPQEYHSHWLSFMPGDNQALLQEKNSLSTYAFITSPSF